MGQVQSRSRKPQIRAQLGVRKQGAGRGNSPRLPSEDAETATL